MPKKNEVMHWGLAVFLTVSAILLFYDTLFGRRVLLDIWRQFLTALQPVLIGAMLAYLLAPTVDFFERKLFSAQLLQAKTRGDFHSKRARAVSIILTWLVICVLVYLLASVLLPELYRSVVQLAGNVEGYYKTILYWLEELLASNQALEKWVMTQMDIYYKDVLQWLRIEALPQVQTVVSAVSGGVVSTMVFLKDLLVGIIVSIYFLATKERCVAHSRKIVCSLFSREKVYWILRSVHKADRIFAGFVRGKILDSIIIGILCFIGCSVLRMPYTPLVSVVVGVTNVIPFFGPFLGAIPSIFLILLDSPIKAVYFMLFVLALQQLDGNVIGPKILGGQTGLSSLWVIVAILVGGSFFGIPGMFFGVPVCACLYSALNFLVETRLRRRGLPLETGAYVRAPVQSPGDEGEKGEEGQ